MKKNSIDGFKAIQNLEEIQGGWRETRYPDGGHDEELVTKDGDSSFIDHRYDCDEGVLEF